MGRKAVGFYWTLPVPWAGFKELPKGIEEAAKASKTIRYQVEAARAHAKENKLDLIHEEAFIEIAPDRSTQKFLSDLGRIAAVCEKEEAVLLCVEFAEAQGWRSHEPLTRWLREQGIESFSLPPDPRMVDGEWFDPRQHFQSWRERQHEWTAGKESRIDAARNHAAELLAQKQTNAMIAQTLNAENLRSATGKPWTGEMVRKLLKS